MTRAMSGQEQEQLVQDAHAAPWGGHEVTGMMVTARAIAAAKSVLTEPFHPIKDCTQDADDLVDFLTMALQVGIEAGLNPVGIAERVLENAESFSVPWLELEEQPGEPW